MENKKKYSAFVEMSKYAGMREDLVQAGGGNSSFKISDEAMLIKASGYQLSDITEENGYAVVNPRIIREAFLNATSIDDLTEQNSNDILKRAFISGKRPSIETFLHSISGKYTLHTHPIVVNALTCRKGGMEILEKMFPQSLTIPYAKPGIELAKAYFKEYKKKNSRTPIFDIVFMQNHGLVVSGSEAQMVIEKTEKIVRLLEQYLGIDYSGYRAITKLWRSFPEKIIWKVTDINVLSVYESMGMWTYQFCPDCMVFLGKRALVLKEEFSKKDILDFVATFGQPVIVIYNNQLYIVADSIRKALEIQSVMSFSAQVMYINKNVECNLLTENQQNVILNWDAEKYRQSIK